MYVTCSEVLTPLPPAHDAGYLDSSIGETQLSSGRGGVYGLGNHIDAYKIHHSAGYYSTIESFIGRLHTHDGCADKHADGMYSTVCRRQTMTTEKLFSLEFE